MQSAKYNILIETGTDFVMPFVIYDDNDIPVDLTGARIEAHLREFEASPDYYEFSCINNGAGGRVTITLPHETTSQIPYSYGVYDVKVEMPDGSISYPLHGEVTVRNGITKSNDGTILFMVGVNSQEELPEVGSVNRMYYDYTNRVIYRWNGTNYVSAFYGGISDIHFKEHIDEYTDCYTIVYDNGKEFDYYVTSKGVYSVEKISSEGNIFTGIVDTYRMTFNNGTYVDYQITNGRMDVEAGIDIEYETPETLVINTTDNTGKYAPKDGNAYVQLNGEWNKINHDISFDSNGVKINDVYSKTETDALLDDKQNTLTFDNTPTANSNNPVKSSGIKTALDAKQNTLTFDNTPTANSNNPVKSSGIKTALNNLQNQIDSINKFAIHICSASEYDSETYIPTVSNPQENTFYLVPTGTGTDMYAEWIYKNNRWEKFGVNSIDLDSYYTKNQTDSLLAKKENAILKSASGSIVSFDDGVEAPAAHVVAKIEPVQEGSGDPSPDNVRPITGWTGVNVTVSPTLNAQDGTTYSIAFPGVSAKYGGKLDVTTGMLTLNRDIVDLGTLNWTKNINVEHTFNSSISNRKQGTSGYFVNGKNVCDSYLFTDSSISSMGQYNACIAFGSGDHSVYVKDTRVNTVEDFIEIVSGVKLVYELAVPIIGRLAPTEITVLSGTNNIWADTGDITIDYKYDINKALADKASNATITNNIELLSKASQNYTAGELAIIQNQLLRITQNIATGGSITIGSNAETIDLETLIAEKAEKILVAKLPFLSSAELYNNTADFHNAMPRGKDITSYLTDGSLWSRINGANGYSLFEDLYVGDYLTAGGQDYMIVDFDYYIREGHTDITEHHLVMMPTGNMSIPEGTVLYGSEDTLTLINTANAGVTVSSLETAINKKWNATMEAPNTHSTAGGYKYSRMRQVIMRAADTIVINAFGADHAKPITVWYPNPADAAASGLASNAAWFANDDWTAPDRKSICDLPIETQIFGQQICGRGSTWNNGGHEIGIDKWQFALFKNNRARANIRAFWWFRSVFSTTNACHVYVNGVVGYYGSATALGVRPRFLLVG